MNIRIQFINGIGNKRVFELLTIKAPTQQNRETHSNNLSAFADEVFKCV